LFLFIAVVVIIIIIIIINMISIAPYAGTARRLKRDKVVKIARLSSCKNFVSEREKFIFDAFVDLYPVERFENGSDISGFRSLNNSASKSVLNLLEPVKLTVWKVMIHYSSQV